MWENTRFGQGAEGGTSLGVQWLKLHASNAGVQVPSLVWELRSHMPCCMGEKKGGQKELGKCMAQSLDCVFHKKQLRTGKSE